MYLEQMLLFKATYIAFNHAFNKNAHFIKLMRRIEPMISVVDARSTVWVIGMELIILNCP